MELAEVVRRRRMVRSFDGRPVDAAILDGLLAQALRAPSAGNVQATELLVLTTVGERETFWDAAFPDRDKGFRWPRLLDAPVVVVPCASEAAYHDRYAEPDKAGHGGWCAPWWDIDCGMVVHGLLLGGVDVGLGALLFGWRPVRTDAVKAAFAIPERYRPAGAVAIGHSAPADPPGLSATRRRRPPAEMVHRGTWAG